MKFEKYPSIENHYREEFIQSIRKNPDAMVSEWVVTEKIHGANFSFWTDGNDLRVASRSQFTDGNFNNCHGVIELYKKQIKDIFNSLNNIEYMVAYGELYGQGVQKGIHYFNNKDFILFDIAVKEPSKEELTFLSFEKVRELSNTFLVPLVPVIFEGTFSECLNQENTFDSVIANIPENIAEGLVIRPKGKDIHNHRGQRIIIKSKNNKWSEKQTKKIKNRPRNLEHPLQEVISEYINENRVNNVLSKLDNIDINEKKDFGMILGLTSKDVIEDLIKDGNLPEDWKKSDELKPLSGWVTLEIKNLLKELSDEF